MKEHSVCSVKTEYNCNIRRKYVLQTLSRHYLHWYTNTLSCLQKILNFYETMVASFGYCASRSIVFNCLRVPIPFLHSLWCQTFWIKSRLLVYKTKTKNYFFGDFLSTDEYWQKLCELMKSFPKNLSFGVDFKL